MTDTGSLSSAGNGTHPPAGATRKPYASVGDFRARIYRDVTLPSGLLVQIRSVQSFDLISAWDLPLPSSGAREEPAPDTAESRSDTIRRGLEWRDASILHGCVWPPVVPRGEGTDEALGLDELANDDYEALSQAILRHSGLAPEVAERIEAFLPDAERADRGADRSEVPLPPPPGTADDAGRAVLEYPPGEPGHERGSPTPVSPTAGQNSGPADSLATIPDSPGAAG